MTMEKVRCVSSH